MEGRRIGGRPVKAQLIVTLQCGTLKLCNSRQAAGIAKQEAAQMDLSAIGRQYGLDPAQTEAAVAALAPVIAAGFKRSASQGDGLASIFEALQQDEQRGQIASPTDAGNVVLGQIFGSKDVSRGVAQQLSASSGVSSAILKQLLPVIATYFISQMLSGRGAAASTGSGGGGLGDILGSVLGGGSAPRSAPAQRTAPGGDLGDVIGNILNGAGAPRSASAQQLPEGGGLGDILGQVLGGSSGTPASRQAGASGGGLGDVLGGMLGGGQSQGGGLGDILGQVLGGAGGAQKTSSADDLLASLQAALRGR